MHALSIESAIEQPSCSCQRFIGSSDRRHISLCVRFVNPDRPRGVSRRSNLGDLLEIQSGSTSGRSNLGDLLGDWLGAPSRRAVVGVAVRQLGPPSLRCCARRRHPPACNERCNQWQSEAISGNQRQSPCMARDSALGYQWQSTAIKSNQRQSEAIPLHGARLGSRVSVAINGHQEQSALIRRSSALIMHLRGDLACLSLPAGGFCKQQARHHHHCQLLMREAIRCHQGPSAADEGGHGNQRSSASTPAASASSLRYLVSHRSRCCRWL